MVLLLFLLIFFLLLRPQLITDEEKIPEVIQGRQSLGCFDTCHLIFFCLSPVSDIIMMCPPFSLQLVSCMPLKRLCTVDFSKLLCSVCLLMLSLFNCNNWLAVCFKGTFFTCYLYDVGLFCVTIFHYFIDLVFV